MSGKTRRILYYIYLAAVMLCGAAGTALLAYFGMRFGDVGSAVTVLVFVACLFLVPLHTILHEAGHALCGLLCGMRLVSLSVGYVRFDWERKFAVKFNFTPRANGATALLPKNGRGVRGKLIFSLLGGPLSDLIYGAVFLTLFFVLPHALPLMFFVLFAPIALAEGLLALYPAELDAGPTDGAFALGLMKRTPDAEVALRVMEVQGSLYRHSYAELSPASFDAPVVREDSPAFLALTQLKWRFLLSRGERGDEERATLARYVSLFEYVPAEQRGEVAADLACAKLLAFGDREGAEEYRSALTGNSTAELVAKFALDGGDGAETLARRAAEKEKFRGERDYFQTLLLLIKK